MKTGYHSDGSPKQSMRSPKRPIHFVVIVPLLLGLALISIVVFIQQIHAETDSPGNLAASAYSSLQTSGNISAPNSMLETTVPDDFTPMSEFKIYNADNLHEEIDGKAPLYIDSGFVELAIQRFSSKKDENLWMEISLFDMGSPKNAYSILSVQRSAETYPLSIVDPYYGYKTGNALYFIHGKYYIELVGSAESNGLFEAMTTTARNIQANIVIDKAIEIPQLNLFPRDNMLEGSTKLYLTNAFGFDGLQDVFVCRYKIRGQSITAFLSECDSIQDAQAKADSYYEFLVKNGAKNRTADNPLFKDKGVRILDFYKTIEIIFIVGPIMGGIHEADDQQAAETLAGIMIDGLSKETSIK